MDKLISSLSLFFLSLSETYKHFLFLMSQVTEKSKGIISCNLVVVNIS